MKPPLFALALVAAAAAILSSTQIQAESISMDFERACQGSMQHGMAEYRECIYARRIDEAQKIDTTKCSERKCYYKLANTGRVRKSTSEPGDDESSYITIFRHTKFFLIDDDFRTGDTEFSYGKLLVDEAGAPTIVGQCTGNGCTDLYYVRGAHRGAKLYGPFASSQRKFWILELPR